MRKFAMKKYQKWFLCYHLPCSFKIFTKTLLSSMQSRILRKSGKKHPYILQALKRIDVGAFVDIQDKAGYLEKLRGYPQYFFVDCNSPCKDLLFSRLAQIPLYLVGNVLKCFKRSIKYKNGCLSNTSISFLLGLKTKALVL